MTGYIYRITNPEGSIYIGQTTNLKERERTYKYNKSKGQLLIYTSIVNYGWRCHIFDIIEVIICNNVDDLTEILNEREIYYVKIYKSNRSRYREERGLNLTDGGGGMRGYKQSETTRLRRAKPVECYSKTGEFIKSFPSLYDAERCYTKVSKIHKPNHIFVSMKDKLFAYGFIWKYATDNVSVIQETIDNVRRKKEARIVPEQWVPVTSFNPDGTLYMKFESITHAAKFFQGDNIDRGKSTITIGLKSRYRAFDKYWVYDRDLGNLDEIKKNWSIYKRGRDTYKLKEVIEVKNELTCV